MAINIAGTSDYLRRQASFPTTAQLDAFTVMCWVSLTVNDNSYQAIWVLQGANFATPYIGLWFDWLSGDGLDGDSVNCFTNDGADKANLQGEGPVLALNTWYHEALVRDGGTITLYHSSEDLVTDCVKQFEIAADPTFSPANLYIGSDTLNEDLNGRVESFKFYTDPLQVNEIREERDHHRIVRPEGVFESHPLIYNDRDETGNSREFTENGTVTYEQGPAIANDQILTPTFVGSFPG
jgi:hypothetical protein